MESNSLNANKRNLTEEEMQTLEKMQGRLKSFFDYAVRKRYWETTNEKICISVASGGYAMITDILSRNRKAPNP